MEGLLDTRSPLVALKNAADEPFRKAPDAGLAACTVYNLLPDRGNAPPLVVEAGCKNELWAGLLDEARSWALHPAVQLWSFVLRFAKPGYALMHAFLHVHAITLHAFGFFCVLHDCMYQANADLPVVLDIVSLVHSHVMHHKVVCISTSRAQMVIIIKIHLHNNGPPRIWVGFCWKKGSTIYYLSPISIGAGADCTGPGALPRCTEATMVGRDALWSASHDCCAKKRYKSLLGRYAKSLTTGQPSEASQQRVL